MLHGWDIQYGRIAAEFGYDTMQDAQAADLLAAMLPGPPDLGRIRDVIYAKSVICAGAGESLFNCIPYMARSSAPCIAADSALGPLIQHNIWPDIVVTDLDGYADLEDVSARGAIIVVHAHGNNRDRLDMVQRLLGCIGTCQSPPPEHVHNWGGFTDGDRTVFLASWFGASRIILCGMDLGGPVTDWSNSTPEKPRKLRAAARLLEWLAGFTQSELYTTSYPLRGFSVITPDCIPRLAFRPNKNNSRTPYVTHGESEQ